MSGFAALVEGSVYWPVLRGVRRGVFLSLFVLLGGCERPEPEPLRIAVNAWPGYQYFAIAQEQGFAEQAGLPGIRLVETASLADSVRAFERHQVDLIGGTLAELVRINSGDGREARAVLALNRSVGADMIVARDRFETLGSLRSARLALEPGSVNALVLAAAARRAELDLGELTLVSMPQSEMERGFVEGEIDAAVTYPPVSGQLLDRPDIHRLFDTRQVSDAVIDILIADKSVIETSPEDLQALVTAYERSLDWSREYPEKSRRIIARHAGMEREALIDVESSIEMLSISGQKAMWEPGGVLARDLEGAMRVLGQIPDIRGTNTSSAPGMLDASVINALAPP